MITISITADEYREHKELIARLCEALSTDSQSLSKQTAAAGSTSDKRWNRFVEFRNVDGQLCTQVVSGTEASLDKQFINNKQYKPKWVSEFMPSEEALMWAAGQALADADDSNSWRV